jgi:hypothetical protein
MPEAVEPNPSHETNATEIPKKRRWAGQGQAIGLEAAFRGDAGPEKGGHDVQIYGSFHENSGKGPAPGHRRLRGLMTHSRRPAVTAVV